MPAIAMASEAPTVMPSIQRQKSYVMENAQFLDRKTNLTILNIVMMECPEDAREGGPLKEVNVDLDHIGDTNPDVLGQIYNLVRARIDAINRPAVAGIDD